MSETTPKKKNELEVTLLAVTPRDKGQFSAKQNKTYWFAYAEVPTTPLTGNIFSTCRLTCVRNEPFPAHWVEGATVLAKIRDLNGRKGEGEIDVV